MRMLFLTLSFSLAAQAQVADWCGDALELPLNRVTRQDIDAGVLLADGGTGTVPGDDARLSDAGVAACFTGIGHTSLTNDAVRGSGRDTVWRFTPPADGLYSFRTGRSLPITIDRVVYLTNTCLPASSYYSDTECLVAANRTQTGANVQEELSCVSLNEGEPVYLWVDTLTTSSTAGATFDLEVTGCTPEVEPNDSPADAGALSCAVTGGIRTASEADFYFIGALPWGTRAYALVEAAASNALDYDLRVTTAAYTVEYDDANAAGLFGETSAAIAGAPLPFEPTYLRVNYRTAATAEPYVLHSRFAYGAPVPEAEPNDTPQTANVTGSRRYFAGELPDAGDVDFFAFDAQEGDLIFAAVDLFPSRALPVPVAAAAASVSVTVTDGDGNALLLVNDTLATAANLTATDAGFTVLTPNVPAEALVYRAMSTGSHLLRLGRTNTTAGVVPYHLLLSVGCSDAPVEVTNWSPLSGTPAGDTEVTFTGTGFHANTQVYFAGLPATVVSQTPTQLVVRTPAVPFGQTAEVWVTDALGRPQVPDTFLYEDPPGPPTLLSVEPATLPGTLGGALTLRGTVFREDATVFIDGAPIAPGDVTVHSSTLITLVAPPHATGAVDVRVENLDTLGSTLPAALVYVGPPVITEVQPPVGLTTGGELVTLLGQDLRAQTRVFIGGAEATGVDIALDGLSLTALTPFSAVSGPVDVRALALDTQEGWLDGGFTYVYAPPLPASLSPLRGFSSGGTLVTLTGTGLRGGATVNFIVGGVAQPGTAVTPLGSAATQLRVTTPAHAVGLADVQVINDDAQQGTLSAAYRFDGPPVISAVTPDVGRTDGGDAVTITGEEFRPDASVFFGIRAATGVVVAPDGLSLTAVTPFNTLNGPVGVRVRNLDTQESTLDGGFTYVYPTPVITQVDPARGHQQGNTLITIHGANFFTSPQTAGLPDVYVGGEPATQVTFTPGGIRLTARTPAGAAGSADVTVVNKDGQGVTLPNGFFYDAAPIVAQVTPAAGPAQGGTRITITGQFFSPNAQVTVGGVPAFAVAVQSDTQLAATTNTLPPGLHPVTVINADGQQASLSDAFTAGEGPGLTELSPRAGLAVGGTVVTLTGSNFGSGLTVRFGAAAATGVTVVSAGEATVVTPPHAPGLASVSVQNTDGQSATLESAFRFVAEPVLLSLSPSTGDVAGGEVVRLLGAGFGTDAKVTFGEAPSSEVTYLSSGELAALAPPHAEGAVTVSVATQGATLSLANAYTYSRGQPVVNAVTPDQGPEAGGTVVNVSGQGFAPGATVSIGGQSALEVTVVSGALLRAVTPPHAAGAADVFVTNPDGQAGVLAGGFVYASPPPVVDDTLADGGSGTIGAPPDGVQVPGGVSCGCTSVDGSVWFAALALVPWLTRRRRFR